MESDGVLGKIVFLTPSRSKERTDYDGRPRNFANDSHGAGGP